MRYRSRQSAKAVIAIVIPNELVMSSTKSFIRPLLEKHEVILISDDEDEQDSRDTNVTGCVPISKRRRSSSTVSLCNDNNSNGTPPLCEPQTNNKKPKVKDEFSEGPEASCRISLGIDQPVSEVPGPSSSGVEEKNCKRDNPVESDATNTKSEARHFSSLVIDEPLITPLPVNEGETFNRAEYKVPPLLIEMSEQSNKIVIQFLDTCMPHLPERDRPLILQKVKELLNQTNLHYLVSDRFRKTVASIANSVQKDSESTNVYNCIKELADELRSRREKKSKKKKTSCVVVGEGSNTSSTGFTGTSDEDTSDSKHGIPDMPLASDSVASHSRLSASVSSALSSSAAPDSSSVAQTETTSAAVTRKQCVDEREGENREEKCSNGVDSAGETSGVLQVSEKQLRIEHYIRKLEKHLVKLHRAIKKLREEEVDLNCDDVNSAYIQEDRFKRKAVAVWQKICELEQKRVTTGLERERKFRYKGTRFTEINAMVEKVVNKRRNNRRVFPDYKDILDVVRSGNETHGLGLSAREEKCLAEEVFQEVGRELQRRRQRDELADAEAYLEDVPGLPSTGDPAKDDKELLEKLENNAKLSRSKLNEVIEVYVAKQEELKLEAKEVEQDNCDLSSHPSESGESEDEDEDDDYLRNPSASLNDVSPSESAVEQEKTKLDSEGICDLSTSNNSSESEDSANEENDCKEEECVKVFEKDSLGNDRRSSKADVKDKVGAEAARQVISPITVEDKESSQTPPADGDSHQGMPHVEKGTDGQDSSPCGALHQGSLLPGTETTSGTKGSHKEVPQLLTKKRECSLKQRLSPEEDVITILSDDEELLPPPAKIAKHTSL